MIMARKDGNMRQVIITDPIMGAEPYKFGQWAACKNEPCCPEEYFTSDDCIVHYTLGYVSIKGESEITKDLLARHDSPTINKTLAVLEWQIRYKDTKRANGWHWITEEEMRTKLLALHSDPEEIMNHMRKNTRLVITGSAFADYRHFEDEHLGIEI
jgi:hypothetical protein